MVELKTKDLPLIMDRLESVQGTLSDTKTQTRRIIRPQPPARWHYNEFDDQIDKHAFTAHTRHEVNDLRYTTSWEWRRCPYGKAGDRLWVREPWRVGKGYDEIAPPEASAQIMRKWFDADGAAPKWAGRRRLARFMPRWASRILLEVLEVRVQRIQEISAEDCRAEGVQPFVSPTAPGFLKGVPCTCISEPEALVGLPKLADQWTKDDFWRHWFAVGWIELHGKGSWERNDFVFAITYRRVKP